MTPLVQCLLVASIIAAILYGTVAWAVFIVAVLLLLFLPTPVDPDL